MDHSLLRSPTSWKLTGSSQLTEGPIMPRGHKKIPLYPTYKTTRGESLDGSLALIGTSAAPKTGANSSRRASRIRKLHRKTRTGCLTCRFVNYRRLMDDVVMANEMGNLEPGESSAMKPSLRVRAVLSSVGTVKGTLLISGHLPNRLSKAPVASWYRGQLQTLAWARRGYILARCSRTSFKVVIFNTTAKKSLLRSEGPMLPHCGKGSFHSQVKRSPS